MRILAFPMALLLCAGPLHAQAITPAEQSKIDALVNDALTKTKVPSATIAVVRGGKIVLAKAYGKASETIPVATTSDLAEVRRIADEVGLQLAADPEYGERVMAPPRYLRVDGIDANGVAVQVNGTVRPGSQWEIAGVLRARLLEAMRTNGIKTPWG